MGSQYPKERFEKHIEVLVCSVPISLTARTEDGLLVGVCFGITDFACWLFITDLGADRRYVKQGIGQILMRMAHALAGGEKDIILYTCANEKAVEFYEKLGMRPAPDTMVLDWSDWTPFTVEEA